MEQEQIDEDLGLDASEFLNYQKIIIVINTYDIFLHRSGRFSGYLDQAKAPPGKISNFIKTKDII